MKDNLCMPPSDFPLYDMLKTINPVLGDPDYVERFFLQEFDPIEIIDLDIAIITEIHRHI